MESKKELQLVKRLTVEEAAIRLGVSAACLRRAVRRRAITCFRPSGTGHGRPIFFTEENLKEFEARNTHPARGP